MQETQGLFGFMNRLPELINPNLPFLMPGGTFWFYVRPRFNNPLQGKWFRMDDGFWLKVTEYFDINFGAQPYIWRDPDDQNRTRWGFTGIYGGIKYAKYIAIVQGSEMSFGINCATPVGRPPISLIDGYRHTDPYVTYTQPIVPRLRVVGYSTLGLDLLAHSPMPSNFGTNQLHTDSITFSVGASREWRRFTGFLTLSGSTNEFISKDGRQVFTLTPQVIYPLLFLRQSLPRWNIRVVGSTHVTDGPDGRQYGASASVHIDFRSHR
jgi:hypothetical protein